MTAWYDKFLLDREPKRWRVREGLPGSVVPAVVFVQDAPNGLEVALGTATARPTTTAMRRIWKARHQGRSAPVLVVVAYPSSDGSMLAAVCGPAGDDPAVYTDLEISLVERLAATALSEPDRHAALRCVLRLLPEVESDLPGLLNSGLLATHELRSGVPMRSDWEAATAEAKPKLRKRGRELVEALGYEISQLGSATSLLTAGAERRAVAVFLDEGETFDAPGQRFDGVSPVSHALAVADKEHLSWVVLTRGPEIRLYAAKPDTGVGRKGRADTFVEINVALLPEDRAGYLQLLLSADALTDGGTLEQILDASGRFAADLASRLRERVYDEAVPALATAIASRLDGDLDEEALTSAYEQTLTIIFRLLFVAYGEDKDLLPYKTNSRYADHSLKRIAKRLVEDLQHGHTDFDERACDLWENVVQIWDAIDRGNKGWGVPEYNGGLFSSDPDVKPAGAALSRLKLTNAEFGPALRALLVDTGDGGIIGPVDFRSLSVREFGTIYEGLLESQLSVAPSDLTVDKKGSYVPAREGEPVVVSAGEVYLHNRSGSRKSTGSYFTKPFAVEHLLDHALEPALDDHLQRVHSLLERGDGAAAAAAFFDFRCADIAMGSGHFLVAAVDRIEARLSAFLALNPIPAVLAELDQLRRTALEALGDLADGVPIETTSLLRRQVARRCIYGVDRNTIAVELARLAIWIHTFVPGLPLSFLDHNLVSGDSLTGIATVDEALEILGQDDERTGTINIMRTQIEAFLDRASDALRRLGTIADATVPDVKQARNAHTEALERVAPAAALFDLLVAHRLAVAELPASIEEAAILGAAERELQDAAGKSARAVAREVRALHFPVAFPEVFVRERPGFDCILGNPPWEEATVEELGFWALRFPGLKSLSQADQKKEIVGLRKSRPDLVAEYEQALADAERTRRLLLGGPYPGMGTGDPDLYKAFTWRFWQTCRDGGAIGVVLPRSALSAKGSAPWREQVLSQGEFDDVTLLLNNAQWVFDDVHPQYTIGLVSIRKGNEFAGQISVRGPYPNLARFAAGKLAAPVTFAVDDFRTWTEHASFPLIPSPEALTVFLKLRSHERFDSTARSWSARPITEFHATSDKHFMILSRDDAGNSAWPVYKGASFDIWNPDTGTYYAWADPVVVVEELQRRRVAGLRRSNSVFYGSDPQWAADPETLPCRQPRIAFRDVTNRTNTRTVVACLVPRNLVLTNNAPYLLWARGDERDQAFVLGMLCSMPLDWYARRFVETHVNFHIFNSLPIPDPGRDHPRRRRVEEIAGRLAACDDRFAAWADAVGVPVASVGDDERPDLLAELDAAVALLYGLDETDLRIVYETFHEAADYGEHCERVLAHVRRLS